MKEYCPDCGGKMKRKGDSLICTKCKGAISLIDGKFYVYAPNFDPPKKTNFERIQELTFEQMVVFIVKYLGGPHCDVCGRRSHSEGCIPANCIDFIKEFLNREAEI